MTYEEFAASQGVPASEIKAHLASLKSPEELTKIDSSAPNAARVLQEGEQNVAKQGEALKELPAPDIKGATDIFLKNILPQSEDIDATSIALGAAGMGAAFGANKIYKNLKEKMRGGTTAQTPEATASENTFNTFPEEKIQTTTTKPTLEQLRERVGLPAEPVEQTFEQKRAAAANAARQQMGQPSSVTPPAAAPAAKPAATPAAEPNIANAVKPRRTPAEILNVALNPAEVAGQPGMRTQYTKPSGINPATGKNYIGPGGYNYFASQVGHDVAPAAWEQQYGQKNVPYKQVEAEYAATRYPPTKKTIAGKSGGAAGTPEHIPNYIKGEATLPGMLNVAGNALGIMGLISDYKEAKKTGDWSNFGLNATGQAIANLAPKAALGTQLATYSEALGESPEELKALGKRLQDAQQAFKVGGGRGSQGVPPPSTR